MVPTSLMLLGLLFFAFSLQAQKPQLKFGHLGLEDGLGLTGIFNIHQDQQGFLWLCTDEGLHRYDGYGFRVYRNDPANSKSISDNGVNKIIEDQQGKLWISTDNGLNSFDPKTEHFQTYFPDTSYFGLVENRIYDIYCDREGMIWADFEDELFRLNPKTGRFQNLDLPI